MYCHAIWRAAKRRCISSSQFGLSCRNLYGVKVKTDWESLLNYLDTENAVELKVVTGVISKKVLGNPLEKYYVVDNKAMLDKIKVLTRHTDQQVRANSRRVLHCVGVVPKPRPGIRILSIDGGGTRGIISISVLKKLEALTGKRVHELFDLCIGTSTGALLVALLIAQRKPLDEVLEIYLELSKEVFGGRSVLAMGRFVWKQHRYSTQTWEEVLQNTCQEHRMADLSCHDNSPLIAFVSSVVNHEVVHPYVFRSYDLPYVSNKKEVYRGGYAHYVWEGLRASTAAPSYFREVALGGDVHVDGALLYNNPTALGVREAKRVWPDDQLHCVVSIGSGKLPWQYRSIEAKPPSLFDTMNHVIAGATETETTHLTLTDLLKKDVYYRFNPNIKEITPLDAINSEVLQNLILQTDSFIRKNSSKFQSCSKALLLEPVDNCHKTPTWNNINKLLGEK